MCTNRFCLLSVQFKNPHKPAKFLGIFLLKQMGWSWKGKKTLQVLTECTLAASWQLLGMHELHALAGQMKSCTQGLHCWKGGTHQVLHKSTQDTDLLLNHNMGFCSLLSHRWRPFISRVTHSMLSTWNTWLLVTLETFAVLFLTFPKEKKKSLLPVGTKASLVTPTTRTSTRQQHCLHSLSSQNILGSISLFLLARSNREA